MTEKDINMWKNEPEEFIRKDEDISPHALNN